VFIENKSQDLCGDLIGWPFTDAAREVCAATGLEKRQNAFRRSNFRNSNLSLFRKSPTRLA